MEIVCVLAMIVLFIVLCISLIGFLINYNKSIDNEISKEILSHFEPVEDEGDLDALIKFIHENQPINYLIPDKDSEDNQ